jgi:hypothetical protein
MSKQPASSAALPNRSKAFLWSLGILLWVAVAVVLLPIASWFPNVPGVSQGVEMVKPWITGLGIAGLIFWLIGGYLAEAIHRYHHQ